ncbi:nitroreductase family protein [Dermatobacter hominis]|uniref:nitroreductase family protein n=1 Tax=Dermatobacter hominis TaxID=2884263 RepID=UPI001D1130E1|nr:nitroreductase family protein [Dermatobacter hominis]UDY36478.1 nitroreductase family protein [Dermatobacter hominis]
MSDEADGAAPPRELSDAEADLVLGAIATTRAVRRYRPEPVPTEDLSRILFAATRAPSGSNRQPVRFLVLRGSETALAAKGLIGGAARRIWAAKRAEDGYDAGTGADPTSPKARTAATMEHFVDHFEEIPVVILVAALRSRPGPEETIGASIYPACQNLLLAARALGYGGVMMTWHRAVDAELRELLGIPDDVFLAATITMGRPRGGHGPVRRMPLEAFVYEDGWERTVDWTSEPPGTRHTRWRR